MSFLKISGNTVHIEKKIKKDSGDHSAGHQK